MVVRTLRRYAQSFPRTLAVVRPEDLTIVALIDALAESTDGLTDALNVDTVLAERAALGMSQSLAAGIVAAADADYAFVALADMPFVRLDTLAKLKAMMETAAKDAIVRPRFNGAPGHPVGFDRAHFEALRSIEGDEGARQVVTDHPANVIDVDVDDPGVIRDIDIPGDA